MPDKPVSPRAVTDPSAVPEKIREKLYPAVLDLFSTHDFHRVNIREISSRTGVSSGTIYKYFGSKEALIFTILNEKIDLVSQRISRHIAGMKDIREVFRKVFWVTMDFYDDNPGVAVTAFITVPMRTWMQDPTYRRKDDLDMLRKHVEQARQDGRIDATLTFRQIVDAYYMICYRCIHNWYFDNMTCRLTHKIDEYFNLFWKIVRP